MNMARRVVLITGASGGLGRVLCRAFGGSDTALAVHACRNLEQGQALVDSQRAAGGDAALFCADGRNALAVREMFDGIVTRWGRLDLLIHAIGIARDRLLRNMTEETWDEVIAVNLSAAFFCFREAGRRMVSQDGRSGRIIAIGSAAADTGRTGQAAYTAAKRGLIALARTAAREWPSVQVNVVIPGLLQTPMTAALSTRRRAEIVQENTLGHFTTVEEVSRFTVHLAGLSGVSGQIFHLDRRIV